MSAIAPASGTDIVLHSEQDIAARVAEIARAIARARPRPDLAVPILTGAFVFAADLLRALMREGLDLDVEFACLRSYGHAERAGSVQVLKPPGEIVRGRTVLLIDGVLDSGGTLARAKELLLEAGAAAVLSAVAVRKVHPARGFEADYACFEDGTEFLFGYGMDLAGLSRGVPDIRVRARGNAV